MSNIEFSPYFHPTQIVLIDDDIDFLGNLSLQLDADLAYLLFDSTDKALNYLNRRQPGEYSRDCLFSGCQPSRDKELETCNHENLEIDTDALQRKMHDSDRFARISVALVDYSMPQMNGLEFCQRIQDPHVKKILFTGVATESVAVDAFNQGIIDKYIRKHEQAVYTTLNDAIRAFQNEYIRSVFESANDVFSLNVPPLLTDPAVGKLIDRLRGSHDLAEYYLCSNPPGFMFATANGQVKRLVILSGHQYQSGAERARAFGAPSECVQQLAQGRIILDPTFELALNYRNWSNHAQSTEALAESDSDCRWVIFDMPTDSGYARARPSYNEFLEWLDTMGYSLM